MLQSLLSRSWAAAHGLYRDVVFRLHSATQGKYLPLSNDESERMEQTRRPRTKWLTFFIALFVFFGVAGGLAISPRSPSSGMDAVEHNVTDRLTTIV